LIQEIKPALAVQGIAHNRLAGIERQRAADVAPANDLE
jgi:hypothetical protein